MPVLLCYLVFGSLLSSIALFLHGLLLGLNIFLVAVRSALCLAIPPSEHRNGASGKWLFWLSPKYPTSQKSRVSKVLSSS
ncbi:MAG: hypothetical protein ACM65M_19710 [Microcoleus sp.]